MLVKLDISTRRVPVELMLVLWLWVVWNTPSNPHWKRHCVSCGMASYDGCGDCQWDFF